MTVDSARDSRLKAQQMLCRTALACSLFLCAPAGAMVGGAQTSGLRSAVMIVGSRGNFCTGTLIARDLVLTAAHCVLPGADYKLVEFDAARQPKLRDVASVARHPQFDLRRMEGHLATADVALLKLASAPPNATPAPLAPASFRASVGESLTVAGYGLSERGNGKTGGTLRAAALIATGQPGNLQIRLYDPATRGERAGLGACTGDSGAPVFAARGGRPELIGVVSWSTAANNAEGCGGLTGVTPLALYRGWIVETAGKMGSPVAP